MVTMKDVAKEAGVSVATVSNYINNTKSVSASRGNRIADAIEKLHYVPNYMAKSLKSNCNNNVGIILPNISDNYYVQLLQGIESFFAEKNVYINLGITRDLPEMEEKYVQNFLQRKVAGLILVSSQPENKEFFENIRKMGTAIACIDRDIGDTEVNFLTFQNRDTLQRLTESFLRKGKRNITLITGPLNYSCEYEAREGYIAAFQHFGRVAQEDKMLQTHLSKEAAFRTAMLHLQNGRPDVIITTSKLVTLGIMESLAITGYRVPEDVMVATLGEDNWNKFHDFENIIATARQPLQLGNKAAQLLYSQMMSPKMVEAQTEIMEDKYDAAKDIIRLDPVCKKFRKELKVLLLDTLQTDLFMGLIQHFKNKFQIDIKVEKIPQHNLLFELYRKQKQCDVMMFDMPWLYSLAKDEVISDITPYLESKNFAADIYLDGCLDYFGKFGDRYYGLPFMYAPQVLFYRKDLFSDRILQNEYMKLYHGKLRSPRTWTEFNTICEFFTKQYNPISPTDYGTAIPAAYEECLMPEIYMRMRAYGGEVYDENFQVAIQSPQTKKAYSSFMELLRFTSPNYRTLNDLAVVDEFLNGKIAMLVTYPSFIADINNLQSRCLVGQVGFANIPGKCPLLGGWSLGISNDSKNKDEAFAFIHWACGEEIANYSTIMAGQSAITKTFDNNELISLYPWLPLYKDTYKTAEPVIPPYRKDNEIIPQDKIDNIIARWIYEMMDDPTVSIDTAIQKTQNELLRLFYQYGYSI